jgi:ABC-type glycerol-3-phosphate transport system substrate-binding protein
MKKSFRFIAMLLVTVLMAFLVLGCTSSKPTESEGAGNTAAQTTDTQSPKQSTEKAKLLVWEHTPQFEEPLKQVIAAFEAKNPDIDVEYEIKTADQYYNLLSTTIQAGEAPDLFWTNGTATSNYENYAKQGVLMELTDKVDYSIFPPAAIKLIDIDGRYYSTPGATADTRAVYYNKDIFKELGLSVPKTLGRTLSDDEGLGGIHPCQGKQQLVGYRRALWRLGCVGRGGRKLYRRNTEDAHRDGFLCAFHSIAEPRGQSSRVCV